MLAAGAEILGCAINDNDSSERIDYRYMAVWKIPSKSFSEQLESSTKKIGFLDYFEQANFSGQLIPPPVMNNDMITL